VKIKVVRFFRAFSSALLRTGSRLDETCREMAGKVFLDSASRQTVSGQASAE